MVLHPRCDQGRGAAGGGESFTIIIMKPPKTTKRCVICNAEFTTNYPDRFFTCRTSCSRLYGHNCRKMLGQSGRYKNIKKKWKDENPEKCARYNKKWKDENPEKCARYNKKYKDANRKKVNEWHRVNNAIRAAIKHEVEEEVRSLVPA